MGVLDRLGLRSPARTDKPLGRSGTANTQGFISEEERNAALRWPTSLDTYDLMRRADPTVRWMLALVKTPIRAAQWAVEPTGADDAAREVAAFCEHALVTELDGGLDDFLRRALSFLDFGHSVFERVAEYKQVDFTYQNDAGEQVEVSREGFVIRQLAERLQRTILRWNPDPKDVARLGSIQQVLPDGGAPVIAAERLVLFTNEQEGDDWRGTSILRSAYRSYEYKQKLENLEAIAYERSTGLPVVYTPTGADDAQLDAIESALKSLRQGESVYLVIPGPKAGTVANEEGWLVEGVSISGDADRSASEAINRHETAMARNVLAEFMRLGHEQVGARATADIQQDPYYQAIEALVRYVEDTVTEKVVAPLVAWNYGDVAVPRFTASKITAKNVQVIASAAAGLLQSGGISADLDTENALRELLDLPARKPPAEGEMPAELPGGAPPKNPSPQTFAEFRPSRALRPEEESVAFAEIAKRLDTAQADFADIARTALQDAIAEAERKAQEAVALRDIEAVAEISVDPAAVADAIARELVSLYEDGRRQVRAELRRQRKAFAEEGALPDPPPWIALAASTVALNVSGAATRAIRMRAIFEIEHPGVRVTGLGYDPRAAVNGEAKRAALGQVSLAFNNGRRDEQLSRAPEINYTIYTALLDTNTCGPCEESDGNHGPPGGDPQTPVPNPDCEGGGACRCMWIPVSLGPGAAPGTPGTSIGISG